MKTKNKTFKIVMMCGMMTLAALISACGLDSFATGDLTAVKNSLPSASAKKAESQTANWIKINEVFGHKWLISYDHAAKEATLKVAIVVWDEDRHELTQVVHGCEEVFGASTVRAGGEQVQIPINSIKSVIDDCYREHDPSTTQSAPNIEAYPEIQFDIFGRWNKAPSTSDAVVFHDSFKYGFNQINATTIEVFLAGGGLNKSSIDGVSAPVVIGQKTEFMASTVLNNWGSVHDPALTASYLEHFTKVNSGPLTPTLKELKGKQNAFIVDLTNKNLNINVPPGFELDYFIIDPKGYGGGSAG